MTYSHKIREGGISMGETGMLIMWIVITALSVGAEALTTELIAIWFMPAGIIAAILSSCHVSQFWQIFSFLAIAIIGVLFSQLFLKRFVKRNDTKTNIDAIIGQKCVVLERIDNLAGCGQVKVKGQIWSARSYSDEITFEVGDSIDILAIEGVKVICKK